MVKVPLQPKYFLFTIKQLQLPLDILSDLEKQANDLILILFYTLVEQTTDLEQAACTRPWKLNCSSYWALVELLCLSWWQTSPQYVDSCLFGFRQASFISLIMILALLPQPNSCFDFPWNSCFPENVFALEPGVSYMVRARVTGICLVFRKLLNAEQWGFSSLSSVNLCPCSVRWDWYRGCGRQQ